MKKSNLILFSIIAISLMNAPIVAARSTVDVETLNQVAKLQGAGKIAEAYALATQSIEKIRGEIGVDRVVKTIQNNITLVQDEVVTEHHSRSGSGSFGFSWFGGKLSGSDSNSYSTDYDVTRLIDRSARERASFSNRTSSDRQALKAYLVDYVSDNAADLVTLKSLAIQAFQLIVQRADKGDWTSQFEMEKILLAADGLHFVGQQQVTVCVQTNHASSTDSASGSSSISFEWKDILGVRESSQHSRSDRTNAYQESACSSTVNTVEVSDADLVYQINLSQLDETLRKWIALASAKVMLQNPHQPLFPTWGNPYYRD